MKTSKTAGSKEKEKFRRTSLWKNFRKSMKRLNKVDFITNKPLLTGFQVHHLDESLVNYKKLAPSRFVTLNRNSHSFIHWIERYDWEIVLLRIASIMFKMDKYQLKEKTDQQIRVGKVFKEIIRQEEICSE